MYRVALYKEFIVRKKTMCTILKIFLYKEHTYYIVFQINRQLKAAVVVFILFLFCASCQSPPLSTPSEEPGRGVRGFTRDPSQLQGSILQTALRKSPQGFGFTIIGGDRPDEFLQVKNVLPDGPAAHDNKIASGKL